MIELVSLTKSLSADELMVIKSSFKKPVGEEEFYLLEKLFDYILLHPAESISDAVLLKSLYSESKPSALAKLKSRLFQHLLDTICSENSITKDSIFDPSERNEIRIRKKMLQFRVLYRKKNKADYTVLIHLLNEIIKEAKEYELYDLLLEALHHKLFISRFRKGFKDVVEIEKQIEFYSFAQQALLKTHEHFSNLLTNKVHIQNISYKEERAFFKEAMQEIEHFIKVTNSSFIKYIFKMMQLEELQREKKHAATIDICLDLISLLNKDKILFRKERMGQIYDNISQCQVYNNDHMNAILSVQKAQKYYSKNTRSFLVSKEQEFYATFYAGRCNAALLIIDDLQKNSLLNMGEYTRHQFLFLKACTLFQLQQYRESMAICNEALEISKDKARWDIGIRYLRIMNKIELNDHDSAYDYIEALRKVLSRNNGKNMISSRDEIIFRALNEYAHSGLSSFPSPKLQELLKKLNTKNEDYSWEYFTHELIPVHLWISSKLSSGKTNTEVPVPAKIRKNPE